MAISLLFSRIENGTTFFGGGRNHGMAAAEAPPKTNASHAPPLKKINSFTFSKFVVIWFAKKDQKVVPFPLE